MGLFGDRLDFLGGSDSESTTRPNATAPTQSERQARARLIDILFGGQAISGFGERIGGNDPRAGSLGDVIQKQLGLSAGYLGGYGDRVAAADASLSAAANPAFSGGGRATSGLGAGLTQAEALRGLAEAEARSGLSHDEFVSQITQAGQALAPRFSQAPPGLGFRSYDLPATYGAPGSLQAALGQNEANAFLDDQRFRAQQARIGGYLESDLAGGNQATLADLARIGGATDLAIGSGLSDLAQFQADTLDRLRTASASRGLRPSDTPITDQFQDVAQEGSRVAGNLISNLRQRQLEQQLLFPLQRGALGTQQFSALSGAALGTRGLGQGVLSEGEALRQGQVNRGLTSGQNFLNSSNPLGAYEALRNSRLRSGTTTTGSATQAPIQTFSQLAGGLGGLLGAF